MYELYIWYPWNFGRWMHRGKFETQEKLNSQIKNKRETTYKVIKDNEVVEYHEAPNYCWRYGMVRP